MAVDEHGFPSMDEVPEGHTHAWYEVALTDARVGIEKDIPWIVCKFRNGPTATGEIHQWYRAHCLN